MKFKFTLLFISIFKQCLCQQQSISIAPYNFSVLVGNDAKLNCTILNQQGEVTWCKDGFCTFGRNRNYTNSRLSLSGDPTKGEHNLLIKNITILDNVGYQCQVSASEKSASVKSNIAFLTVLIKPNRTYILSNNIKNNSTIRLVMKLNSIVECVSEDSNPPVDFNWYLENQLLAVGGDVIEISKKVEQNKITKLYKTIGKLVVKVDTDSKWNGKFLKCESYNDATKALNIQEFDTKPIMVHFAPILNIVKLYTGDLIEDDIMKVECSADARPSITNYKWSIESKIYGNGPEEKYLTLRIDNTMHKKLLKCEATNEVSTQNTTISLDITYKPKIINILPSHKLVPLNEKLVLNCEVDSNPPASIFWKLNGTTIYGYPNITIESMHYESYGTYTCEALLKNFPVVSTSVKVIPPGPPIIESDSIQNAYIGFEAIIEALTEIEPKAETVLWFKDNNTIEKQSKKYKHNAINIPFKGIKHTLTIYGTNQEDFTNYTFMAINKYGKSKVQIELLPKSNTLETYIILISVISIIFVVLLTVGGCILYRYLKTRDTKKKNIKRLKKKLKIKRFFNQNPYMQSAYTNIDKKKLSYISPIVEYKRAYPNNRNSSQILVSPKLAHYRTNSSYSPEPYELINSRKQTPNYYIEDNIYINNSKYQTDV